MTARRMGWCATAVLGGGLLLLSAGCVATADDGYADAPNLSVGIGLGYYDQYGGDYGGWGPGYGVGPYRGGGPGPRRGEGGGGGRGFRSAPASRATPSIPSGARGGGHGGGHGGGRGGH